MKKHQTRTPTQDRLGLRRGQGGCAVKAPNVIRLFHCATCGKCTLEPIRKNHMTAGDFTKACGGVTEEKTYQLAGVAVRANGTGRVRSPRKKAAA